MKTIVIDGQGGRMGKTLIEKIHEKYPELEILAIGTNSIATAAMMKAGATTGATGENPVIVACRDADIVIGPIGIVIADALFGEITPAMATAISQSRAQKILLPVNKCKNYVAGCKNQALTGYIDDVLVFLETLVK